jgi:PAS domain S-box-containing protein
MDEGSQAGNSNEIYFSLDRNGVILDIDENIEKLSGYKKEELIGQNFRLFIYPQDLPGLFLSFQKALDGMLEPYDYRLVIKNGECVPVRSSSVPVKQNGVSVGIKGALVKI